MPRPSNKADLIKLSEDNFYNLLHYIEQLSNQNFTFPSGMMNRNIRDVLAHLYHWQLMMLKWYKVGMAGEKPIMPAEGYTWKTVPDLNQKIWLTYQQTDLNEISNLLKGTHFQLLELIEKHSNEELFTKKYFAWTGSTSLGSYLVSALSSHYDWAIKLLKKAVKLVLKNP